MDKKSSLYRYRSMEVHVEQHLLVASAHAEGGRPPKEDFGDRPSSATTPPQPNPGPAFLSQSAYSILVGQVLSVLVASTGAATTLLNQYTGNSVAMPAAQNCPNYLIMTLFLLWSPTRALRVRRGCFGAGGSACSHAPVETPVAATLATDAPASASSSAAAEADAGAAAAVNPGGAAPASDDAWWRYALLAIVDVEANVVAVWAYRYT